MVADELIVREEQMYLRYIFYQEIQKRYPFLGK